jgi:DmsE family decaheme c-type cytochrome
LTSPSYASDRPRHRAKPGPYWEEKRLEPVSGSIPRIPDAEMINDDQICMVCHETFVNLHQKDIHREQSCETCHGPASQHVRARGKEPGTILSFKRMSPADRSEVCMKCHEQNACAPGPKWRTSAHAHSGVSCTDCHKAHYNVPPGTPPAQLAGLGDSQPLVKPARAQEPSKSEQEPAKPDPKALKAESRFLGAANPDTCTRCHQQQAEMKDASHPHQIGGARGFSCTTCHDPHTNVRAPNRTEQCLQCHKGQHPQWETSWHAKSGVACADCHNPHLASPAIRAGDPQTCYRCHQQFAELERVGHPHQVCGATGLRCATCHDPHGNIRAETRTDLCLQCHKGHPTMAWPSSIHSQYGVACVDCHNPHPSTDVPQFVDIQHTHVRRPQRLPMAVEEPFACYKCHAKIAALFELPSHHPVREGKMVCSGCHDAHGQAERNLREPTVNLTCYKCHAEKQGPFVYEHPPATENCDICHNPHGTVANNLLRQPATFLCLRCHSGHRGTFAPIDRDKTIRPAFYTDCTQCHAQVHGSDLPSDTRLGPRLTR